MRFTQHPSNNAVLGAPPGMPHEQCSALPVTRVQYQDGSPGIMSYWRPDAAELAALASGAVIRLSVLGGVMPPVLLEVEKA